jgi:hypothetical protein
MYRHDPTWLQGRVPFARALGAPPPPRLAEERPLFGLRLRLIERVRKEIAAGAYDTEAKWEQALERLFNAVDGE